MQAAAEPMETRGTARPAPADARAFSAAERPLVAPDFRRRVVALLGLPFDALDLDAAVGAVRDAAFADRRLFISTPNLNFAVTAMRDAAFRTSVLRSDLCLVDGMPLVWLARLLRLGMPGRVAGADLFEALQRHAGPPLRVFFFGGPPGAAAAAAARLADPAAGLVCVGHDDAGHGDLASMSGGERIDRINACRPHFVAVSLGARKGQAWIESNAARLRAPVLCHVGAVVNFVAGTVRRAPPWMQRSGLEWLWRIREEPALFRRYAGDLVAVAPVLAQRMLARSAGHDRRATATELAWRDDGGRQRLVLRGAWTAAAVPWLAAALEEARARGAALHIDASGVDALDDHVLGLLLVADGWFRSRGGFCVEGASAPLARSLRRRLAGALLDTEAP